MNGLDFCKLIDSGTRPVITFKGAITEQEVFLDPGMRGRVVSVNTAQGMDDFIHVYVDLSEFADHNRQFAPDNCAKFGDFWIAPDIEIEVFEIVEDFRVALFQDYVQSGSENSYVEWLEDFVRGAKELQASPTSDQPKGGSKVEPPERNRTLHASPITGR